MQKPLTYVSGDAVITDPIGLHARPAVKVTKLAKSFVADIQIAGEAQEKWVNAKSPSAVMRLKAGHGEKLLLRANGEDAEGAVTALIALITNNFEG